jgi:plastocyanin
MGKSLVRLLLGVLLARGLCGFVSAAPPSQATTWNLLIGGESADQALQVQTFLPSSVTINEGDTISWSMNAAFVHTVTFLSGGPPPPEPIPSGEGNTLMLNPVNAFPVGGPNYDGTGFVGSGILDRKGATFSLTFTKAGQYSYVCMLHPGMGAQVTVQAAGSAYPQTQAQVSAQANVELYAKLGHANNLATASQLTSKANADGTSTYTVINGVGGDQASVLRFLPVDVHIKVGDSVDFPVRDPHEIHTVTFYDPAGAVPPFLAPLPQASGPPKLIIPHAMPAGGTQVSDPKGFYNSGIVGPNQTYAFTFTQPGTYTYVCVIHAPQGMFGKVIVDAAGPPASLPRTGEGTPPPWLPQLGIALLLIGLGALVRGLWLVRLGRSRGY